MSASLYSQPETAEAKASKPDPVLPKSKVKGEFTTRNSITVLMSGVAIGVVIGAGGFALVDAAYPLPGENPSYQISSSSAQTILEAVQYQDGTYVADATYSVPAADDKVHRIQVTVEVENEQIKSVNIIELNEEGATVENNYLASFVTELSDVVVGKPLDSVSGMELVSGSTLTADAFKVALAEVQVKAEDAAQAAEKYTNGSYYVESTFDVPEYDLSHTLGVTITVKDGLITEVEVIEVDENSDPVENEHIVEFDQALDQLIVGKTIDKSLNLDTVSGSSYTTIGFNDAMVMVRDDALKN